MIPCSICKKHFDTLRALKEHAITSRAHHPCDYCERIFRNQYTLGRHVDAKHLTKEREELSYTCRRCDRSFTSQLNLNEHYRGSNAHPTCLKCGKGYENERLYNEHQREHYQQEYFPQECHPQEHHPQVICRSCDMTVKDDLPKHYLDSANHPTCRQCKAGFVDDHELEQHCLLLHDITRCKQCQRQYDSMTELQRHYLTSINHPTCSICQLGFETKKLQRAHILSTHSHSVIQSSDTQSFASRTSSLEIDSRSSTPSRRSISPPLITKEQDPLSAWTARDFPSNASTTATFPNTSSGIADATMTKGQMLQHERFLAETNITDRSSTFTPDIASPIANESIVPKNDDYGSNRAHLFWSVNSPSPPSGEIQSPEVQSPIGLEALPTISPTPSTPISQSTIAPAQRDPWSQWRGPLDKTVSRPMLPNISTRLSGKPVESVKSSISTSLSRDLVRLGFNKRTDSLLDIQAPDLSSPALRNDLTWNFDPSTLKSNSTRRIDQWHPIEPTYQKAVTRPSSTSTLNSGSGGNSEERNSTLNSSLSSSTVATMSLHCRLCMRDPCADPTATMCGHIFCGTCITECVILSPRCPVCQHALLLYCLFKLDLSS
ncbi:hypothetical protein J3R30DRAFT_1615204 [Lentinula aciculospora]|uniref:RING-type domain-containing protein n=1 Tax=Lentinula aciculospora TaxID=153920 RepID=A0A9W8ZXS3_9AGAR|nr:hypothetical protein J3R30DRAFT_1615204 [Lentinula aciculospora]